MSRNDRNRSGIKNDAWRGINMARTDILGALVLTLLGGIFVDLCDVVRVLDFVSTSPPPLMLVINDLVSRPSPLVAG